jgi:serine/tyrosine/threonine adenylyltransferase
MFEKIANSYTENLIGDPIEENYIRQVKNACYSFVQPTPCSNPHTIKVSDHLANELQISESDLKSQSFLEIFSGNKVIKDTKPFAMCYGGHQFGHWAGQLGDGRAINLFETVVNNNRYAFQLKGAGKTPYSRSADGMAVLRSSIREFLCSESMYHLDVPTTRALSLIGTGDQILRDMLYDGNSAYEPGAVVCRVAPSFIRFGNFQILTAQNDIANLKKLTDYTIEYFFPEVKYGEYADFFQVVVTSTIKMIVEWERVGFVHGVMNTDNMSILGLTIDYGPYGWIDDYNPNWTPNTTDRQDKRYRFGNQINIAYWNLYQLANALYPLINDAKTIESILDTIPDLYSHLHFEMKSKKLGLSIDNESSENVIQELNKLLYQSEMDMTLFYRNLSSLETIGEDKLLEKLPEMSYATKFNNFVQPWKNWLERYQQLLKQDPKENRKEMMDKVNPKYVLRNYMAQMAIDKAYQGDYSLIDELYQLLCLPYNEQNHLEKWFTKRPEWAKTKVGSSMLSCSS